jgi:hypothetical protein
MTNIYHLNDADRPIRKPRRLCAEGRYINGLLQLSLFYISTHTPTITSMEQPAFEEAHSGSTSEETRSIGKRNVHYSIQNSS